MTQDSKGVTTSLEYKEHREFFERYNNYKGKAHELLSFCYTDKNKLVPAFQGLSLLISYTTNYIDKVEEIEEMLNKIPILINKDKEKAFNEMKDIFKLVAIRHEESELIPKKRVESKRSEDIWRKEEDIIKKEMIKAMSDILMRDV